MRLHRFYVSQTVGLQKEVTVHSAELSNQIRRVFRLKKGDPVIIFDGSGFDYECIIADLTDQSVILDIETSERSPFMPARQICLCAAVVKKDAFEWIVQKATELGVTRIIPVMAERSEKKALNEERLKKIAIEAAEQSGRGAVPEIQPIMALVESIEYVKRLSQLKCVAFHTEGEAFDRDEISKTDPLAIFIGPEGGWSPDEIGLFHENKILVRCLGKQILRAETAVIAALSQVAFSD